MIVSVAQAQIFFLALVRVLAMMISLPMLGGNNIPMQVRAGTGFILTMVLVSWQKPLPPDAETMSAFMMGMGITKEMIIGTLMGFSAVMTFGAVQVAANFMGLNTGFAAGQTLNPTFGSSGSAYDNMYLIICTIFFLVIDGHLMFIKAMALSFNIIPVNSPFPAFDIEPLIRITSTLIRSGVQLALPVIAAVVMTDITSGLLARVAPQIQVFFLAIDVKILLSLIAVVLAFGITVPWLRDLFEQIAPRSLMLIGAQ